MKLEVKKFVLFSSIFIFLIMDMSGVLVSAATITVTSPNGGETWAPGTTHTISWTSTGIAAGETVHIYIDESSTIESFAPTGTNGGSYNWTIPSGWSEGNSRKIKIGYWNGAAWVYDYSNNYFCIAGGSGCSCTDSDGGNNINVRGNVTYRVNTFSYMYEDSCPYGNGLATLREWNCTGFAHMNTDIICSGGKVCSNGVCCVLKTCANYPGQCAYGLSNGCADGILDCRTSCPSGQVCYNDFCCTPYTCAANYPGLCGSSLSNNCGGTLNCAGNCAAGKVCNSGTCCTPYTCAANYPGLCGSSLSNNCGGTLNCAGNCPGGQVCNSGTCCTPNCAGKACGAADGCGGLCQIGTCPTGSSCINGICVCTPNCAGRNCGLDPVCGASCGSCTSPATCNATGQCVGSGEDITGCMIINSPGTYIVQNNINVNSGDVCIHINSSNVVVDGNGKKISNSGTVDYGVAVFVPIKTGVTPIILKNITIKNLTVENTGQAGIFLYFSANINVSNNNLNNNPNGIHLLNTSDSIISNNNLNNNSQGIATSYGNNLTISNNRLNDSYLGIAIVYSSNYSITKNEVSSTNPLSAGLDINAKQDNGAGTIVSDNKFCNNQRYDIFIYNFTFSGCLSLKGTGNRIDKVNSTCAWPVFGVDYTACGGAPPQDITGCLTINSPGTYTLQNNIIVNSGDICIYINSSNVSINGNGKKISNSNFTLYGVYGSPIKNLKNITIKNLTLENFNQSGIYLGQSTSIILSDNKFNSNYEGIYLFSSTNITISNNDMNDNNDRGISSFSDKNINISNNNLDNNRIGIMIYDASDYSIRENEVLSTNNQGFIGLYIRTNQDNGAKTNISNNKVCYYQENDLYLLREHSSDCLNLKGAGNQMDKISSQCPWPVSGMDYTACGGACVPNCAGKECGEPDECGGSCTEGCLSILSCSNLSVSDCTNPSKWSEDILQSIESSYPDTSVPGGFCTGEPYSENIPGYPDCKLTLKCSCVWDAINNDCVGNVENALINLTADGCDGIITGNCTQSAPDVKGDCTTNDLQTIFTTSSWIGTPIPGISDYIYTSYLGCITDPNVTREIPCPPDAGENLPFFGMFNLIIAGIAIAIVYFMISARRKKYL